MESESQVTAGTPLWRFMVLRACLPAGATRRVYLQTRPDLSESYGWTLWLSALWSQPSGPASEATSQKAHPLALALLCVGETPLCPCRVAVWGFTATELLRTLIPPGHLTRPCCPWGAVVCPWVSRLLCSA